MSLPLEDVVVVSLEQAVAAPYATRQLADLGARIIKIERPEVGDFARGYDEVVLGGSSYFTWLNRSKESVALDLKRPGAVELVRRLLAGADVFVQNLAPGACDRLGLATELLRTAYPSLIVCNVSGYGADGPWSERKAYDLLVQAETGLVSITGTPESPAKVGISIADIAAGMYAFSGVLGALIRRQRDGRGSTLDISLFDALAEWMGAPAYYTMYSGKPPGRAGVEHATIAPYGPFRAADGMEVLVAVQNDREWSAFCDVVLGEPDLAEDERFARNSARVAHRSELNALIARRVAGLASSVLFALLERAGIAEARLNTVAEFLDHPVLEGRDRWRDVQTPGGMVRALLPPGLPVDAAPRMDPVPAVGQHTRPVLRSFGLADEEIGELLADRIAWEPPQ